MGRRRDLDDDNDDKGLNGDGKYADDDSENDHDEDVGNDEGNNDEDEGKNDDKGEKFNCDNNVGENDASKNDDDNSESNVDEDEGLRRKLMMEMKVVMMRILSVTDSLSGSPGSRQALRLWSLHWPEEGASHRLLQEPQPQSAQRPHQAKSASACKICHSAPFRWNQQHKN